MSVSTDDAEKVNEAAEEEKNEPVVLTSEEILQKLAEDNARQTAAVEKQLFWTKVQTWAVCGTLVLMLIVVLAFMGRINSALNQLDVVLTNVQDVTESLKTTVDDADITGLLKNADALILKSGDSLTEALGKIEEAVDEFKKVDFDGLNSAISDLQAVVEPMAKLFGKK